MKKIVFIVLGLVMISLSCNKLQDTLNATCKVVKVTAQDGVSSFEYKDNDKIISVTNQSSNTKITISYDDAGRVYKMEYYHMQDNISQGYTSFNWEDKNHVDANIYLYDVNGNPWLDSKEKYELNDNNDPIKQEYYQKDENENWFVESYNEIIWNKGNIVRIETFERNSETEEFKNIKTRLYEYDTQTNPWRNLSVRSVIDDFSTFPISANNPVTVKITINTTGNSVLVKNDYQYNSSNYPVSYIRTKTNSETGEVLETYNVSAIDYNCN